MANTLLIGMSAMAMLLLPLAANAEPYSLGIYTGANCCVSKVRRQSLYVPMQDGTRIAVDIYRPENTSGPDTQKRPVIFEYTRYGRAVPTEDGGARFHDLRADRAGNVDVSDTPDRSTYNLLLRHGYVLVVADLRGAGASFGPSLEEGDPHEERDLYDLITWISAQPWSNGRVGMYGVSYGAEVQPRATVHKPAALRALVMVQGLFDEANGGYAMGGVFRNGWLGAWDTAVEELDNRDDATKREISNIPPVDGDTNGDLLKLAVSDHRRGVPGMRFGPMANALKRDGMVRDKIAFIDQRQAWGQNNLYTLLPYHNAANTPTLLVGGWNDMFPDDMLLWNENLTVPRRLLMGSWAHGGNWGPAIQHPMNIDYRKVGIEALRWFDHWLKRDDAANIDAMPPIQFSVFDANDHSEWHAAPYWPLPSSSTSTLYLSPGTSGTDRSSNDGILSMTSAATSGYESYVPDERTGTGSGIDGRSTQRWYRRPYAARPDMTDNDWKALTFTTEPFDQDRCLVGNAIFNLDIAASGVTVANLHAYLEAVDAQGRSRYITEGLLRTSHRTLGVPPYRNFGLPFQAGTSGAIATTPPLSERPVRLQFRTMATAYRFKPGERLRVAFTLYDRNNTAGDMLPKDASISLWYGPRGSHVELPFMPC